VKITVIHAIPSKTGLTEFADEHNLELEVTYTENGVYVKFRDVEIIGTGDVYGWSSNSCIPVAIHDYCSAISDKILVYSKGTENETAILCPTVYHDVVLS
jgi:hypothetical protein